MKPIEGFGFRSKSRIAVEKHIYSMTSQPKREPMDETNWHDLISLAQEQAEENTEDKNERIQSLLARARTLCWRPYSYTSLADAYISLLEDTTRAAECYQAAIQSNPDEDGPYRSWATMVVKWEKNPTKAGEILTKGWEHAKKLNGYHAHRLRTGLAKTFATVCVDKQTARSILSEAKEEARSVTDLCDLIEANLLCGAEQTVVHDLEKNVEKMIEEHIQEGDRDLVIDDYCSFALTYQNAISNTAASQSIFHKALQYAETTEQTLLVAFNWYLLFKDRLDVLDQMFQKAEKVARSFEDWMQLAQRAKEQSRDRDEIRKYLETALKESDSVEQKKEVAQGFRIWMEMPERASDIMPSGIFPRDIAISRGLDGFEADATQLFTSLKEQLTPETLDSIAKADHDFDYEAHITQLQEIQRSSLLPIPIDASLGEVLSLSRWASGQSINHVQRAFACTILYLDTGHPTSRYATENIIPHLLLSTIELGETFVQQLQALLVWRFGVESPHAPSQSDIPSLVGICLCEIRQNPSGERLSLLIEKLSELMLDDLKQQKSDWDAKNAVGEEYAPSTYRAQSPAEWIWERLDNGMHGTVWKQVCGRFLSAAKAKAGDTATLQYFESTFPQA